MTYITPQDKADVISLLQTARWRCSQIVGHADGQAEPKLIKLWAEDGRYAVQAVLDFIEAKSLALGGKSRQHTRTQPHSIQCFLTKPNRNLTISTGTSGMRTAWRKLPTSTETRPLLIDEWMVA